MVGKKKKKEEEKEKIDLARAARQSAKLGKRIWDQEYEKARLGSAEQRPERSGDEEHK